MCLLDHLCYWIQVTFIQKNKNKTKNSKRIIEYTLSRDSSDFDFVDKIDLNK